jgi:hypothetical protein
MLPGASNGSTARGIPRVRSTSARSRDALGRPASRRNPARGHVFLSDFNAFGNRLRDFLGDFAPAKSFAEGDGGLGA